MRKLRIIMGSIFGALALLFVAGCNDVGDKYTVRYIYGTECAIEVSAGKMYEMTEIPVKDGYTFDGLYDAEDGGVKYVGSDGKSVRPFTDGKDVKLYVRFVALEYTFDFCYNEGTLSDSGARSATYGNTVAELPILTVGEHRVFNGWYTAEVNGEIVADGNGEVADSYKTFDYTKYENGENYKVKLYASVCYEKVNVKFYNEQDGVKTLLDEHEVEYGTNIVEASLGIKSGNLDVTAWTVDGVSVFTGTIVEECELFVKHIGTAVDLEAGARTVQIAGNNASVLLYGKAGKEYADVNIAVGGNANDALIFLYNAHFSGNSANGTINSSSNRAVNLYSLGESNEIRSTVSGTSAISVSGDLTIYGDADLSVYGANGANATVNSRAGGEGGAAIFADSLFVNLKDEATLSCYGGNGGNGKNGADATGKSTGSHSPDPGGDGGYGGNGGCGVLANGVTINTGAIKLYGGAGGNGASGGKGQDSSHNDRNPAGRGGWGGYGGNGGAGLKCDELSITFAVVSCYGGKGGNGANGGKGGNASDNDWYDKTDYGGPGGDGGGGGNGGNGIVCGSIDEDSYFSAVGGSFGLGGKGGNGGSGYGYGNNGSDGNDGRSGEASGAV